MKTTLLSLALLLTAACSSPRTNVTEQDESGNYVTTSDYQAQVREDFMTSMKAGLADFDTRMTELRQRANELGGDTLQEFSVFADELEDKRIDFVNELERTKATLADQWPDQRQRTLDAYHELRDLLDKAFEEVLEEA